jgi:pyruvate formate lyase activating enzyme
MDHSENIKGIVFNIQRFCVDDGPGIRTSVFLKGCNMRCFWCHNPESQHKKPEIQYFVAKCIGCGHCADLCPSKARNLQAGSLTYDRAVCTQCGRCVQECPTGALEMCGKEMTATQVMDEVSRDAPFYQNSQGGVTFTGGEPLMQKDFLKAFLVLCREKGFHCAVESALNLPWEYVEAVAPYVDLFLADIKLMDSQRHRQVTGCGNQLILSNIQRLSQSGATLHIRIPLIPGINDTQKDMEEIATFISGLKGISAVQLMPFHNLAQGKYQSLDRLSSTDGMIPPKEETISRLSQAFVVAGLPYVR